MCFPLSWLLEEKDMCLDNYKLKIETEKEEKRQKIEEQKRLEEQKKKEEKAKREKHIFDIMDMLEKESENEH